MKHLQTASLLTRGVLRFLAPSLSSRLPRVQPSVRSLCSPLPQNTNTNDRFMIASKIDSEVWEKAEKESLLYPDYFGVGELFTVEDLFNARLHLGHTLGTLNDYMVPYIFGSRLGYLIIDLEKTAVRLKTALNFLAHIAFRDGVILFVCRHHQYQHLVEETAASCGEYAHTRQFNGDELTNSVHIYGMEVRLPDVIVLLSTQDLIMDEHKVVNAAAKLSIPVVGIVDTNSDPRLVTYPVPASDDSEDSVGYLARLFAEAIMKGKKKRQSLIT